MEKIADSVKGFILSEFLTGENPSVVAQDTPLISAGVLDSIGTLRLVDFLETSFGIRISASEVTLDNLDDLNKIVALIERKLASA